MNVKKSRKMTKYKRGFLLLLLSYSASFALFAYLLKMFLRDDLLKLKSTSWATDIPAIVAVTSTVALGAAFLAIRQRGTVWYKLAVFVAVVAISVYVALTIGGYFRIKW